MATFLELAQKLASESGTVNDAGGAKPTAVTSQTGRLGKIVRWTNDAWRSIQNAHSTWLWMRSEFTGQTVAGTRSYAGTEFSDERASAVISRFAEWLHSGHEDENRYSIYLTSSGVAAEGVLRFRNWDWFYVNCMRGTQVQDQPVYFTVTPENKLALHPIPDAAYTVRGPYRKDVQELAANGDVPEMPARFHDLIVDVALMMLGTNDEAAVQIPLWRLREIQRFCELERDQLPKIRLAGALA